MKGDWVCIVFSWAWREGKGEEYDDLFILCCSSVKGWVWDNFTPVHVGVILAEGNGYLVMVTFKNKKKKSWFITIYEVMYF